MLLLDGYLCVLGKFSSRLSCRYFDTFPHIDQIDNLAYFLTNNCDIFIGAGVLHNKLYCIVTHFMISFQQTLLVYLSFGQFLLSRRQSFIVTPILSYQHSLRKRSTHIINVLSLSIGYIVIVAVYQPQL